jgi:hypothetical protein
MLNVNMLGVANKPFLLRVIMLNVVAPYFALKSILTKVIPGVIEFFDGDGSTASSSFRFFDSVDFSGVRSSFILFGEIFSLWTLSVPGTDSFCDFGEVAIGRKNLVMLAWPDILKEGASELLRYRLEILKSF